MADAVLLDTNIASQLFIDAGLRRWLGELQDTAVFVSSITIGEVEYGLSVSDLDDAKQTAIRESLKVFTVLSVDQDTAHIYGRLRANLFDLYAPRGKKGKIKQKYPQNLIDPVQDKELGITENDLWIVSVAVQYNLRFVTRDDGGGMRNVLKVAEEVNGYDRVELLPPKAAASKSSTI